MAVTVATMTMLKPRCMGINTPTKHCTCQETARRSSFLPAKDLTESFTISKSCDKFTSSTKLDKMAIAGATFSMLSSCDSAIAAQQIADMAEGDNRGLALLLPIIPAVLWALYNVLGPAINQIKRMRSEKGIIIGLGVFGLVASSCFFAPQASSSEIVVISEASTDNRGSLLLLQHSSTSSHSN